MLINLSNHPKENWSEKQKNKAEQLFGELRDLPFPQINPAADENYILEKTKYYVDEIMAIMENSKDEINAVHVMGELTFIYTIVKNLTAQNIICVASTSERNTIEKNGKKITEFNFVRFREYV